MSFDTPRLYDEVHEDDMNVYDQLSGDKSWFNTVLMTHTSDLVGIY